jgi:signal recognition particle subunit SRP54
MGDVLTLIEKAQATIDADQAAQMQKKLRSADFDLEDFRQQLQHFKKMGPLDQIMGLIPGMDRMNKKMKGALQFDEKELVTAEAIISSMTPWERRTPEKIDGSRRRRVAKGSGTSIQDVNRLLKQFEQTKKLVKQFSGWEKAVKKGGKRKLPKLPFM